MLALPLTGKDGTTIWHPARRPDSVDIESPQGIQPGRPPYHMGGYLILWIISQNSVVILY